MLHYEDAFQSGDGTKLHENCWSPNGSTKAVVIAIHGFTEHGGRYARLATSLNENGYKVAAMDLRGHGKSEGDRAYIHSFDDYLSDVRLYIELVREREPDLPIFLFAHSMGGAITTLLAIEGALDEIRGVIFSGPAIHIGDKVFPILRRLAWLASLVFPKLRIVNLGSGRLSRDSMVVDQFQTDPLVFHGCFPVRTANEILRAAAKIQENLKSVNVPFLVVQGGSDSIVSPRGSQMLFERASSADKTLNIYDGFFHEVVSDPEKELVISDIVEWLDSRL